jgi:hypothetical protein
MYFCLNSKSVLYWTQVCQYSVTEVKTQLHKTNLRVENLSRTTIRPSPVRYHAPRATQIKTIDRRVDKMPG